MSKKIILLISIAVLMLSSTISLCAAKQGMLFNNSFELTDDNFPVNWFTKNWLQDSSQPEYKIETGDYHSGEKCISITNNVEDHSRLIQAVSVDENKNYKVSCYIKTENVSEEGKGANISVEQQLVTSNQIKGTSNGWELAELYIAVGAGVKKIDLTVALGGYNGLSTGKAYFDSVEMEEIDSIPEDAIVANITADNEQPPKSTKENKSEKDPGDSNLASKIVLAVLILAVIVVSIVTIKSKKSS
ncbi:MAG: hypothetical protein GX992_02945 [Clostridium sp.]|nr:hypothetical protein [Clostridium sp.]